MEGNRLDERKRGRGKANCCTRSRSCVRACFVRCSGKMRATVLRQERGRCFRSVVFWFGGRWLTNVDRSAGLPKWNEWEGLDWMRALDE
mgnify:CR=1